MSRERVDLRGAPATLLLTLYLRGLDAQSRAPILADGWAEGVMAQIDYDFERFKRARGDAATVACRARVLDAWTSEFLAEHPEGQVVHLGCGLDSRCLRLAVPTTARWVDLDLPSVIDLRRRLYRLPDRVDTVAVSVTDASWTNALSRERVTLFIAEGVLPYLTTPEVYQLVERAAEFVNQGEMTFDVIAPWAAAASRHTRAYREMGAVLRWSYRRQEFEPQHPRLRRQECIAVLNEVADRAPQPWLRATAAVLTRVAPIRDAMQVLRYSLEQDQGSLAMRPTRDRGSGGNPA